MLQVGASFQVPMIMELAAKICAFSLSDDVVFMFALAISLYLL